ncbi:MAG: hypothetical protein HY042_13250 [Spirochaetia bacterium]|nr:hypothetical protein [Spirochaetia bacterium]
MILLKNTTGRRSGRYVRYEYGEDLFGRYYIDVVRGRKHRARMIRSLLFESPRDFVCALDLELYRNESLDYVHEAYA